MTTIYVPRLVGSTLILTITPPVLTSVVRLRGHDGSVIFSGRDGRSKVISRDGMSILKERKT